MILFRHRRPSVATVVIHLDHSSVHRHEYDDLLRRLGHTRYQLVEVRAELNWWRQHGRATGITYRPLTTTKAS